MKNRSDSLRTLLCFALILGLCLGLLPLPAAIRAESVGLTLKDLPDQSFSVTVSAPTWKTTGKEITVTSSPSPFKLSCQIADNSISFSGRVTIQSSAQCYNAKSPSSVTRFIDYKGTLALEESAGKLVAQGPIELFYTDYAAWFSITGRKAKWNSWKKINSTATNEVLITISRQSGQALIEFQVGRYTGKTTIKLDGLAPAPAKEARKGLEVLWSNYNKGAVQNNAKQSHVPFDLPDCSVRELETYHYFSGGKIPETITLVDFETFEKIGVFEAEGFDGQGGRQNARWVAKVELELAAGPYAIVDSDKSTWSNNAESEGLGIAEVRGYRK